MKKLSNFFTFLVYFLKTLKTGSILFCCLILLTLRVNALENNANLLQDTIDSQQSQQSLFDINPIFGDYKHRLGLVGMIGFDEGGFLKLGNLGIHYSQPNHFFRLAGRLSAELETFFDTKDFSEIIFGISQDIVLPLFMDNFYFGVGLGIYIRSQVDSYIGSAFNFGEKVFLGYRFKKVHDYFDIELEAFVKHYSNGSLRLPNIGFNFFGFGVSFLFGDRKETNHS